MKLTLEKLSICDFGAIEEANIYFPQKIIYITGKNASGKSTVFEALALLFTENKKGDKFSDYIRSGCPSQKAQLNFEGFLNGEPLTVEVIITENGLTRAVTYKGSTYQNSECIELFTQLGVIYFSNLIFFMQSEKKVTQMTPGELATTLQKLLEFDLDKYTSQIKEQLDILSTKEIEAQTTLKMLQSKTFTHEDLKELPCTLEEKDNLSNTISDLVQQKSKIITQMSQTTKLNETYRNLESDILQSQNTRDDIQHQIEFKQLELSNNSEKRESIIKFFNEAVEIHNDSTSRLQANITEYQGEIDSLKQAMNTVSHELVEGNNDLNQLEQSIQSMQNHKMLLEKATTLDEHIKELSHVEDLQREELVKQKQLQGQLETCDKAHRIFELIQKGKCPSCGHPITDVHHVELDFEDTLGIFDPNNKWSYQQLVDYIETLNNGLDASKTELRVLDRKKALLEQSITLLKQQGADTVERKSIQELDQIIQDLQGKIDYKKDWVDQQIDLQKFYELKLAKTTTLLNEKQEQLDKLVEPTDADLQQQLSALTSDEKIQEAIDTLQLSLNQINARIEAKQQQLSEIPKPTIVDDSVLQTIDQEINLKQIIVDDFNKITEVNKQILESNKRLDEAKIQNNKDIETTTQTLKEIGDSQVAYKEAKGILEKELPNYLIVKTCAKLEELVNDFVHVVFPDMHVELKQKNRGVNFVYLPPDTGAVDSKKRKKVPAKMASGMEASILSLAWRYALSQAYNLNILMLDEIDAASDPDNSLKIFTELFQDPQFDQFLIISHKKDVRQMLARSFDVFTYKAQNGKITSIDNFDD